jgi:hypothetical protein
MYEKLWKKLSKEWKFWDKGWIMNEKLKLKGYRMDEKLGKMILHIQPLCNLPKLVTLPKEHLFIVEHEYHFNI